VHRDLKPHNILLEARSDRVVLADFGIAEMSEIARSTLTGAVGTPGFMAPEQIRGEPVDGRADLYALGCVLFRMLTGALVFAGKTPIAVSNRHVDEQAPNVRTRRPGVPAWLAQVVARLLERDPARRYPDTGAVLAALAGPRRRRILYLGGTLGVAVLGVAILARPALSPRPWQPALRELPALEENSSSPALSPDGKLFAYASDRDIPGHFRIYLESLADG